MADKHVRARCTTTGAIASLPKRALELGHIRNWVEAPGRVPKRSKSNPFFRPESEPALEPSETAVESEE